MKTLKKITLFSFILTALLFSCSSEDSNNNNNGGDTKLAEEQNATEERAIPLSEIEAGVNIDGATIKTGLPPAPTNNIDFQVASNTATAFQDNGLVLSFSSTDNFNGAYIVLQDVNGNKANSYIEVPQSSIEFGKTKNPKHAKFFNLTKKNDSDYELAIDLNNVNPGKFCYEICLFDSENNISSIEKVCVEVEAWGGNASIVDNWELIEQIYEGENDNITCENGGSVSYDEDDSIVKREASIDIKSNGDFVLNFYEEYKDLDWNKTYETCTLTYYETDIYNERETGKWAYNEATNKLTLVSFKFEDLTNAENNEDYPDGDLVVDSADVEIDGNTMTLTQTYSFGNITETYINIFKRK